MNSRMHLVGYRRRERAAKLKGPQLEDWKINTETAAVSTYRDGGYA